MHIDVRPVARLRGPGAVDVPAALGPVFTALSASPVDLAAAPAGLRLDPVPQQFLRAGRVPPGAGRAGAGRAGAGGQRHAGGPARARQDSLEIAIDLRRCGETDLATRIKELLAAPRQAHPGPVVLEPWVPASGSCIWRFNTLYWQALSQWEQATGREYEQALPGGESDARNSAAGGR